MQQGIEVKQTPQDNKDFFIDIITKGQNLETFFESNPSIGTFIKRWFKRRVVYLGDSEYTVIPPEINLLVICCRYNYPDRTQWQITFELSRGANIYHGEEICGISIISGLARQKRRRSWIEEYNNEQTIKDGPISSHSDYLSDRKVIIAIQALRKLYTQGFFPEKKCSIPLNSPDSITFK